MRFLHRLSILTVVWFATAVSNQMAFGQDDQTEPHVQWLTGRELDRFNKLPIAVWWQDAEFKERLVQFSQTQQIAIFVDRRLNPNTIVDLTLKNVTKEQFLWSVAAETGTGVCRVEDVYFFGTLESAARLNQVCQQHRKQTAKHHKAFKVNWSNRKTLQFDGAVEPKKILADIARENQFRIENLDSIPHDVWSGFEIPRTTLQTRMALLLVGFGKSFERNEDGSVVTIVEFPDMGTTERTLEDLNDPSKFARQMRPQFPDAKLSVRGKRLVVTGPPTNVASIVSLATAAQIPQKVKNAKKVYTFTRRAARGEILATAAQGKNVTLVYDKSNAEVVDALKEIVEIRVVNANAGGLVTMALEGTNLAFEFTASELRIRRP